MPDRPLPAFSVPMTAKWFFDELTMGSIVKRQVTSRTILKTLFAVFLWAGMPLTAAGQVPCSDPTSLDCVISQETNGAWTINVEATSLGGGTLIRLRTNSVDPIPAMFGGETRATLEMTCSDNTTVFGLGFGDNFMSDLGSYGEVVYRVGEGPIETGAFTVGKNNRTLFAPPGTLSINLIRQLFSAGTMNVSARTFTDTRLSIQFDLTGLEEAVTPLRNACGW